MKKLPYREAPTPSSSLSFVNERKTAIAVDKTISQKKPEVKLNRTSEGANSFIAGEITSAPICAIAVIPKPTESTLIVSC